MQRRQPLYYATGFKGSGAGASAQQNIDNFETSLNEGLGIRDAYNEWVRNLRGVHQSTRTKRLIEICNSKGVIAFDLFLHEHQLASNRAERMTAIRKYTERIEKLKGDALYNLYKITEESKNGM